MSSRTQGGTIRKTLWVLPIGLLNHLILGVRYRGRAPSEVVRASKSYTDAQSLKVTPDQIKYVGISHYHGDHTGQLPAFPKATLLIGQGDWDAVNANAQSAANIKKRFIDYSVLWRLRLRRRLVYSQGDSDAPAPLRAPLPP